MSSEKKTNTQQVAKSSKGDAAIEDAANMNFMAQFVNHLLTPGSAISGTMQFAFNSIMIILFVTWGLFLGTMPDSIHVWIFGVIIFGLTLSTNWFLSQVIKMKEEMKDEEGENASEEIAGEKTVKEISEKSAETDKKKNNNKKDDDNVETPISPAKKRQSKKEM